MQKSEDRSARIRTVAWFIVGAALLVGVLTRFVFLFRYIDFDYDQTRDAYIYAAMRHGNWPMLGSYAGFQWYLPPLYYYFVFLFTLPGGDPTFPALPSAIFSFLTIPLLIVALYRFTEPSAQAFGVKNILVFPDAARFFWAALGGLWWSLMVTDIVLGTRAWNPSPLLFFLLLFLLIAAEQLRCAKEEKGSSVAWAALGGLLALLMSMHAIALYTMPLVFFIVTALFVARSRSRRRAVLLACIGASVAIGCLTPYWMSELRNHWANSQSMLQDTYENAAGSYSYMPTFHETPLQKINNAFHAYAWLDGMGYFISDNIVIRCVGLVFLFAIIPIAAVTFRGNRNLLVVLSCTWGVFLCGSAFHPAHEVHYRYLIVQSTIFLTISSLAFLSKTSLTGRVISIFLSCAILLSATTNVLALLRNAEYRYGPSRLVAVSDLIDVFRRIPYNAAVCDDSRKVRNVDESVYRYIDEYVTKRHLRLSETCGPKYYAVIPRHSIHVAEGGIGNGIDALYSQPEDDPLVYLIFSAPQPKPIPPGSQVIESTEALTLVLLQAR